MHHQQSDYSVFGKGATRRMSGALNNLNLSALNVPKFPLRYGTESCYITLTEERFTAEIVALRNNPTLGKYINYVELSAEDHERWLAGQLERDDALNFVLVAKQRFAGTLSLYDIEHGKSCEFGRMMMPDDGRRIYALGAEVLGMSFAFEVLGVQTVYCVVVEGNNPVLNFHLKNGWSRDTRYERFERVNGVSAHLIGLSMDRSMWPACFAAMRPLAKRLFTSPAAATL
jgi:RimJ/RimL family protein N-acetyltransferase